MSEAAVEVEQDPKEGEAAPKESDEDILKEARDRYRLCEQNESDNYTDARNDLRFLSGGENQWDPVDAALRKSQRRPMITVNNLPTFLHQITNEQRMNKLGGLVHPVDDGADEETAKVIQGLIRHIEYDSSASEATTTAVNSAAAIGFGWFRLVTDYESEMSFDQKIMFKRIRNALSVHKDPLSQELDGSDSKFFFIDSLEARKEFERAHPKANASNTSLIGQELYKGWITQETVLVCEYYRIVETPDTLCMYVDGTKGWKSDKSPLAVMIGNDGKPKERKSARRVVEWFKLTGADILERTVIKCDWIPVFPVYGDEIDIDGEVVRSGVIRNAKDSFKMYNVCITTAIEEVSTRAKSPYIMAEGQDEGHETQWANINRIPYASVKYKPTTVDGLLVPPPQRSPMADIPAGWLSMTMHFADNKKATTGLFDSSLGAKGTATSGVQEREQQQQGDIANYHYADNEKITYRHALRCIISMLPHYYDGARTIRILGEDETSEVVTINQPFERPNPKTGAIERVMHDLTVGKFDVTVSAGPSYSTKRQEAAEFMTDAMQAAKDPAAASVLTYLAIKNQDLAGAEEATKMLKKLLPPGVAEPEDGEQEAEPMIPTPHGPMPASKVGPLIEQMGTALQNASQQMEQSKAAEQQAKVLEEQNKAQEAQNTANDLAIRQKDSETKAFEAETARQEAADKAENDRRANDIAQEKAQEEKTRAEAELIRSAADNIRAQIEADSPQVEGEAKPAVPSIEEIAQLIINSRQQINGLSITSPSGQTYSVKMM